MFEGLTLARKYNLNLRSHWWWWGILCNCIPSDAQRVLYIFLYYVLYKKERGFNVAKNNKKPKWIVEICCPFCGELIVEAADYSMLPPDMSDDEREKITCSGDPDFVGFDSHCEHVAYLCEYGYVGSEVPKKWEKEMILVARILNDRRYPQLDNPDKEFIKLIEETWAHEDKKTLENAIEKALPGYDTVFIKREINKGGENPTYAAIFLRKKK